MITGFGGATLDTIHTISHWPGIDETTYITDSRIKPGGMVLGALFAARSLGCRVSFRGALGDDEDGRTMRKFMNERSIDSSDCFILKGKSSPVSQVMIDPEGHRNIFHRRGLRDNDFLKALSVPRLRGSDLLLLDGSWIENSLLWAEEANRENIPIVLDLSPNNTHSLRDELIKRADYPVLPERLAQRITGERDPHKQVNALHCLFGGIVVVTAGEGGVFWTERGEPCRHRPAFRVEVVDTNGAGDTFHGALAAYLCEDLSLEDALCSAMAAAAMKCTGHGQENLPDREKVSEFLIGR